MTATVQVGTEAGFCVREDDLLELFIQQNLDDKDCTWRHVGLDHQTISGIEGSFRLSHSKADLSPQQSFLKGICAMRVIFQPTSEQTGIWAARYVAKSIIEAKPSPKKPFVLGLPTGSSPLGMYKELIRLNKRGKVSFANVVTFNMDEYVGLDPDHPQSYHRFMWDHFFGHIDIKKTNANILDGLAKDLEKECERYEKKIESYGGIDLFTGGIGEDGHLAFNEPGSSLQSRTRLKTLTEDTRKVNARFFGGDPEKVPKLALTVGVGTITDAQEVMILVMGHHKARALQKTVEEGVNHMWTASVLQLHRHAIIVADVDAASELKVGTYNYFRSVESPHFDPDSILKG